MTRRRIARRQIAVAHLQSTERGARLLAACNGDVEHAERIEHALADYDSRPLAPVVHLPRRFECVVDEAGGARPYDVELDPPLEARRTLGEGWPVAFAFGLALWALLLALAYGLAWLVH